jgi:hypothetical protein
MGAAMARRWHASPKAHRWAWNRPGVIPGLACGVVVEPPAGIEPATPSLPWNHREPLCEPPYPQLTPDRKGESYRFSCGQVMCSPSSHVVMVTGAGHHPSREWPGHSRGQPRWAHRVDLRPLDLPPHAQVRAVGPGVRGERPLPGHGCRDRLVGLRTQRKARPPCRLLPVD